MRLIDKDDLMQSLGITTSMDCEKCEWHDNSMWMRGCKRGGAFEDACSAIEDAPTIEERKTGIWLFIDDEVFAGYHICSNCRERAIVDLYGEEVLANFCLNCGADMKGEG